MKSSSQNLILTQYLAVISKVWNVNMFFHSISYSYPKIQKKIKQNNKIMVAH